MPPRREAPTRTRSPRTRPNLQQPDVEDELREEEEAAERERERERAARSENGRVETERQTPPNEDLGEAPAGSFDEETNARYEEVKRGGTHITELQQMTMQQL